MVTIKCTDKQAILIEIALDSMGRMVSGQLHEIITGMDCIKGECFQADLIDGAASGYKLGMHIEECLKPLLFPQLKRNESYGVGQKEIGDAQIAYEMVKKLQNYRAKKDNHREWSCMHHTPLHYSKEPLIEVTGDNLELDK